MPVGAVTLVAEEQGISDDLLYSKAVLWKDKCDGYDETKLKSVLDGLGKLFSVTPALCVKGVCEIILCEGATVAS